VQYSDKYEQTNIRTLFDGTQQLILTKHLWTDFVRTAKFFAEERLESK